jgi:hypothetical protein
MPLASLNHPNVAGIHGVDQDGDACFLARELVPGEPEPWLEGEGEWQVSVDGATSAAFSPDGSKIYYVNRQKLYRITLQTEPEPTSITQRTSLPICSWTAMATVVRTRVM